MTRGPRSRSHGPPAFAEIAAERVVTVAAVAAYKAGSCWERELPCLRAVPAGVTGAELRVVDGYIDLDPNGQPRLGAYAHSAFGVPMIRMAKSRFAAATHAAPVVRDTSGATGPLYVTAAGPPAAARGVLDRRAGFQHHQLHDRRYGRTATELAFRYGSSGRQTVQISSIALLPTAASKASKDARSSLRNLP